MHIKNSFGLYLSEGEVNTVRSMAKALDCEIFSFPVAISTKGGEKVVRHGDLEAIMENGTERELRRFLKAHCMHIENIPKEDQANRSVEKHIESGYSVEEINVILGNVVEIDEGMTAKKYAYMLNCFGSVSTVDELLECMEQFSDVVSKYTMRRVLLDVCTRIMFNNADAGRETAEELLRIFYAA